MREDKFVWLPGDIEIKIPSKKEEENKKETKEEKPREEDKTKKKAGD